MSNKSLEKQQNHDVALKYIKFYNWERFALFTKVLRLSFFWPIQDGYVQLLGRSSIIVFLLLTFLCAFVKLIEELNDVDVNGSHLIDNIFQLSIGVMQISTYVYLVINNHEINTCIKIIVKIYENNQLKGRHILSNDVEKAVHYSTFLTVLIFLSCGGYGLYPVIIPMVLSVIFPGHHLLQKKLPLKLEYFIDEDEYFYYILILNFLSLMLVGLLTSLLVYLQCIIVGVLMGQLQSLEYNLREMDLEYYGKMLTMDKRAADTFLIRRLSEIISQHQNCNDKTRGNNCFAGKAHPHTQCTQLYETSKEIISHVLLIVLSCSSFSFVLCATWMVIALDQELSEAPRVLLASCCMQLSFLIISTPSQLIKNASQDLFIQSSYLKWYCYPSQAKLQYLLMMVRTMKSFELTAGPIKMNFETYSTIIKRSWSFVAAFRSYYTFHFGENNL